MRWCSGCCRADDGRPAPGRFPLGPALDQDSAGTRLRGVVEGLPVAADWLRLAAPACRQHRWRSPCVLRGPGPDSSGAPAAVSPPAPSGCKVGRGFAFLGRLSCRLGAPEHELFQWILSARAAGACRWCVPLVRPTGASHSCYGRRVPPHQAPASSPRYSCSARLVLRMPAALGSQRSTPRTSSSASPIGAGTSAMPAPRRCAACSKARRLRRM